MKALQQLKENLDQEILEKAQTVSVLTKQLELKTYGAYGNEDATKEMRSFYQGVLTGLQVAEIKTQQAIIAAAREV